MPRRRAGAKFQIRRAIAQQCLKPGQKRGNNKSVLKTFIDEYLRNKPALVKAVIECASSLPKVHIVSETLIKQKVYIVDPKTSYPLARLVGTSRQFLIEEIQREWDDISEAPTLSRPSTPDDIEIIELD